MALTKTNDELREVIRRELGYSRTGTLTTTQTADVESVFTDALRRVYDPLGPDGRKYQWSFLEPTVGWTWREGVYQYDLPADFALIDRPIPFAVDSQTVWPPVKLTGIEHVEKRLAMNLASGRPYMAAYRVKAVDSASNTSYEMLCFPTPDQDYAANMRYKVNPLAPRGDAQLPIGDQAHVGLLVEACLAAAEDFDGRVGIHSQRFQERLLASISHDQQVNCPRVLGQNRDASDGGDWTLTDWRNMNSYVVTINGAEYIDG